MNIKIRSTVFLVLVLVVFAVVICSFKKEQQYESWTKQQLLDPADLAKTLNHPKVKQPIVYSIGPGAIIRGSMDIGPVQDIENLDNLKKQLNALPKDGNIVIYCGC